MRLVLPVLLMACLLSGCGDNDNSAPRAQIETAHVRGVVTRDGLPVPEVTVRVLRNSVEQGPAVTTDRRGRFCVEAPAFAEVQVLAQLVPNGPVSDIWSGVRSITTGDFAPCGVGLEYEIVLVSTPI